MKPVRYDKVTAIGDIPIDLPEKNAIYKIQGRIPRFGLFTAECINMPLGRSTDLVLGADWLNENGFLDDIKKRLGMSLLHDKERIDDKELEKGEPLTDEEERQDAIDSAIRTAGINITRAWIPFQPRKKHKLTHSR